MVIFLTRVEKRTQFLSTLTIALEKQNKVSTYDTKIVFIQIRVDNRSEFIMKNREKKINVIVTLKYL